MSEKTIWVAYCVTCGKELDRAANGHLMEAAARRHIRTERVYDMDGAPFTDAHKVLLGYEVESHV
jgi:hypothetical protein